LNADLVVICAWSGATLILPSESKTWATLGRVIKLLKPENMAGLTEQSMPQMVGAVPGSVRGPTAVFAAWALTDAMLTVIEYQCFRSCHSTLAYRQCD
jgi:hypothetical protein